MDLINYKKDGEAFWVDLEVSPVWDEARKLTHWVAVGRDITERKTAEEKIQYLAFYDPLTRLPNRRCCSTACTAHCPPTTGREKAR